MEHLHARMAGQAAAHAYRQSAAAVELEAQGCDRAVVRFFDRLCGMSLRDVQTHTLAAGLDVCSIPPRLSRSWEAKR